MQNYKIFPIELSKYIESEIIFKTDITECISGLEIRHAKWSKPKVKYALDTLHLNCRQLKLLRSFFLYHKGRALPFLFKDAYQQEESFEIEVANSVSNLKMPTPYFDHETVKIDSNKRNLKTFKIVKDDLHFNRSLSKNEKVQISFERLKLVRFEADKLPLTNIQDENNIIKLIEVKE